MLLQKTCNAAIESLGDIVGKEMARNIVFAKTRHMMVERNGDLNWKIVDELNPSFGGLIIAMNCEYVDAMKKAEKEGITIDKTWTPPEWRAPRWEGDDGEANDHNIEHNATMDNLIEDIGKHWTAKTGEKLSESRVMMYVAGLASNAGKDGCFDGDK